MGWRAGRPSSPPLPSVPPASLARRRLSCEMCSHPEYQPLPRPWSRRRGASNVVKCYIHTCTLAEASYHGRRRACSLCTRRTPLFNALVPLPPLLSLPSPQTMRFVLTRSWSGLHSTSAPPTRFVTLISLGVISHQPPTGAQLSREACLRP